MSNGLKVVSISLPVIKTSLVGNYIYYYENQDAKSLADAIKSVPYEKEFDSRIILDKLNEDFITKLKGQFNWP